ncbi:MAG TPA: ATPase domain-containing protein [Dehalococcoidales bacterium]|nr:ATPase domain-containing protein [Dehalococcoidales bacterium]
MAVTDKKAVILTGIREVDEKLGGGIPIGSLGLTEGHSDSGKSVLCQHLTYGALTVSDLSVAYYTTENTVKSLVNQMASLNLGIMDHFLMDKLRIFPLSMRGDDKDTEARFKALLNHFDKLPGYYKLIIVDSITLLVAHSDQVANIDFFSACKNLCDQGRTILLVAHSYAFDEEVLSRTRSLCDAHFRIRLEQMGDRLVKILEVLKVRGADRPTGDIVTFEVEPKVGMRIIPMSKARV